MTEPEPGPEPPEPMKFEFTIEIPPEAEAGVYADFANIWFTQDIFVLDFVATKGPGVEIVRPPNEPPRAISPTKVVARVRIPPAQVFEIASKLTQGLTAWEQQTGRRPPPSDDDTQLPPI